jgi:hypothetical protein
VNTQEGGGCKMLFRYKKQIDIMEEIELQVPYYFEEIEDGYRNFGKVTRTKVVEIAFGDYEKSREVKIERRDAPETHLDYILRYCVVSTEEKFEAARKEALDFLA